MCVFAEGAAADEAREAGADIVGGSDLVASIRSGDEPLSLFTLLINSFIFAFYWNEYNKHTTSLL